MRENLKVLFLSPEMVPFAKTGGLADVAGSLPSALKRLGVDIRLALPFYRTIREKDFDLNRLITNLEVPLGNENLPANVLETRTADGVPVYLIEREDLYERPNLYGNANGDYYDNLERFAFFSHASLKLSERIPFIPDLIHCHDWQTGLVPALIRGPYRKTSIFNNTSSLFTLHNLGYQGIFPAEKLSITGLPRAGFFHHDGLEYWGKISLLKSGIVYSDAVTTVSPRYAREILTPEYGAGMESILKNREEFLHGILNGIDYSLWDPARDSHIPANYSPRKIAGKRICKEALIHEMGLDSSLVNRPLLGMISRLDVQKGFDLLVKILEDILGMDVGIVILMSGDGGIQRAIEKAVERYPGRVGTFTGFHEPLAHRIMAGGDIFLVPSRYEPCGLSQMYALKYGNVPVVRATGGLDDTVVSFNRKTMEGNGFKFAPYKASAFLNTLRQAVELYHDSMTWNRLMTNGMKADFSWDRSARSYMKIYRSLIQDRQTVGSKQLRQRI